VSKGFKAIFSLALLTFFAALQPALFPGIASVGRWGALLLLILAVLLGLSSAAGRIPKGVLLAAYVFLVWVLATSLWSENFWLSILKGMAYGAVLVSFLVGGSFLGADDDQRNPFAPLRLLFVGSIFTTILAFATMDPWDEGNLAGYFENSNSLGSMLALSSPWLFWELHEQWQNKRKRWFLLGIAFLGAVFLFLSRSRSGMACACCVILAYFLGSRFGKRVISSWSLVFALLLAYSLQPALLDTFVSNYVFKSRSTLLGTREVQMETSLQRALAGGLVGAGFGVNAGSSYHWEFGHFSDFSREKGSSQLGIMEEMGLIGLACYLFLMIVIAFTILNYWLVLRMDAGGRLYCCIVAGVFVGAAIHSTFEAWFIAPSPEAAVYWASMGLGIGGLRRMAAVASRQEEMVPEIIGLDTPTRLVSQE
jgi:hypothetical protein